MCVVGSGYFYILAIKEIKNKKKVKNDCDFDKTKGFGVPILN